MLQARQGVGNVIAERLRVAGPDGRDVPADGTTIGELVCRGSACRRAAGSPRCA